MVRIKSLAKKWKQKSYKCIALDLQTSPSGASYFESDRWWTSLWSLRLPGTIIQNGWFWAFGILIHRETQMTRKNLKWQTKNRLCVNCTQNDLIIQFTNATVFFTSQIHEYNTTGAQARGPHRGPSRYIHHDIVNFYYSKFENNIIQLTNCWGGMFCFFELSYWFSKLSYRFFEVSYRFFQLSCRILNYHTVFWIF